MRPFARIGHCLRCQRMTRIDDGVCAGCLPHVGEKFARFLHRAHTDRSFARLLVTRMEDPDHRERLVRALGYDPAAT